MRVLTEADAAFLNGRLYTFDANNTIVEAIAVRDERVLAIGKTEEIRPLIGSKTKVFDLKGKSAIPGFHDAHCHILFFGLGLLQIDLCGTKSISEIVRAVEERIRTTPPGKWVIAWGYNDNKLVEKRHPTRDDLDPISPEHPVLLNHISGHMGVVNSRALNLAGITRETEDPAGGRIGREESGQPSGVLMEAAMALVKGPQYTVEDMKKALGAANKHLLSEGITSVQDAHAGLTAPHEFRAYQDAVEEGLVKVRVALLPDIDSFPVASGRFDFGWGLHTGFGSTRLRLGPAKIFVDGSLIGCTAALSQPYSSDPRNRGFLVKTKEQIFEQVRMAHEAGWQVALHAIGDRAIEAALDAIENAMGEKAEEYRPRIEHCGVLRADLLERIRRLGVAIVTQPRFIHELGDGFRVALGEERLKLTYPLASLRSTRVAFSSDRPVVNGSPLRGVQAAVCRRTQTGADYVPEERITAEEAIRWYTSGSAYAVFEEQYKGTLEAGKLVDFVVLSKDPFEVEPDRLGEIEVELTVIGGEVVYERQCR